LFYFHKELNLLDWSRSRSRSRSFWSRSHNRFLVSVSVSVLVSHSVVSVLALVSLCSGLINKPAKYNTQVLYWSTKQSNHARLLWRNNKLFSEPADNIWLTRLTGISSRYYSPSHFLSTLPIPIPMNLVYGFHCHGIPRGPMEIPISCIPVLARPFLSVRPPVCHFVTFRYCVQPNEDTMVWFLVYGRTTPLVSKEVKIIGIFLGDRPQRGR